MSTICIKIWYQEKTWKYKTNAKDPVKLIEDYLCAIYGDGKIDNRKAHKRDEYEVSLSLDLSDDMFTLGGNTGNNGLSVGILAHCMNHWNEGKEKE